MTSEVEARMVSRRRMVSLLGLAAVLGFVVSPIGAEAQTDQHHRRHQHYRHRRHAAASRAARRTRRTALRAARRNACSNPDGTNPDGTDAACTKIVAN